MFDEDDDDDDDFGRFADAEEDEGPIVGVDRIDVDPSNDDMMRELYMRVMDASIVLPMKPGRRSHLAKALQDPNEPEFREDVVRGFGGWGPFDFEPPNSTARPGVYMPSVVDSRLGHLETHAHLLEPRRELDSVDAWLRALAGAGLPADSPALLNERFLRGLHEFSNEKYSAEQKREFFTALCEGMALGEHAAGAESSN